MGKTLYLKDSERFALSCLLDDFTVDTIEADLRRVYGEYRPLAEIKKGIVLKLED
jgi:hypothetical protein